MAGRRHFVKILKVEDREEITKSAFDAPGTEGERRADTPHQAADRALIDRQHALERRQAVLYGLFHSLPVQRDRPRQLEISRELDEVEAELNSLREHSASTGARRDAGSEFAKCELGIGAPKQRDPLGAILRQPTLRKQDLPDPFELDNSIGVRSQPFIK
jgi:hypothetical protein